ncbi:hypothetical protein K438DRAFT_1958902 [Mycena galopus ATCC 62051]|nr:hypothetical protein K438DRAFT_1958902 [Mycena galopus ATCC 62051]
MYHGMEENGLPTPNSRSKKVQAEHDACAIKTKRDQWKAASARYYVRHPEIKEKKRLQAAERCAAKKLARRQRDSSKKERIREENKLGEFPKNPDISLPKTGAQMDVVDLFTMQDTWVEGSKSDCVHDLLYGSQPLRVQGEAEGSDETGPMVPNPHKMLPRDPDAWSYLAPRYDSSDDE